MDNMDLLLKEAFEEMVAQEYENRPLEFPEHRFSLKFRIKMYRLINQIGTKEQDSGEKTSILELYRPIHSRRRLVLLVVLLLLLLGGTVVAARTVISWLYQITLEQQEDHVKVNREEKLITENQKETEITEESFPKYKLARIPEGYQLVEKKTDEGFKECVEIYKDSKGNLLLLRQNGHGGITMGNVTYSRDELEEVSVDNFKGYFVKDGNVGSLILSDEYTLVELSGRMTKEELIDLTKELELVE